MTSREPHDEFSEIFGNREIPEELHSVERGGPFESCTACAKKLEGVYQIHKAVRGTECVLEMAVCSECMQGLSSEFSEQSTKAIQEFLRDHGKLGALGSGGDGCEFCTRESDALGNYSITGVCWDAFLILPAIRVCEPCEESLQEMLSKQTRDIYDDFVRDHLPGVPEGVDLNSPVPAFF